MFLLKKFIALFTYALGPLAILLAAALILLFWRGGRWPRRLAAAATAGILLISFGPTGDLLISPLENAYPPLTDMSTVDNISAVDNEVYIVVLGGGSYPRSRGPVTSELSDASAIRLMEGIRLYHSSDDARLIVTGAATSRRRATAQAMAELALQLGVDPDRLITADDTRDTAEEAAAAAAIVGPDDSVVLVTEASHMPRSMILFERAGLHPVPAPTMHRAQENSLHPGGWWPSARNLRKVERAFYEFVGLIWVTSGGS